jgi:carbonic anhydrase
MDAIENADARYDRYDRYDRLVELNVQEQCLGAIKTAAVRLSHAQGGYPTAHGFVFDLRTGPLKDPNRDFPALPKDVRKIYDLTGQEP